MNHKYMRISLLIAISFLFTVSLKAQPYAFQNSSLSSNERAKDLISRLTLEEKAGLMLDQSEAVPRLGIKRFNWWSEALHGLANNGNVTVFPQPIGMAASFDDALIYNVFDAISTETRAKYNEAKQKGLENTRFLSLSVWTPNVNIFRDPRWGRGQETYGEDPYLTARMGVQVVKGLQGPADAKYKKLLACAKHFAVHSGPEPVRHSINISNVDPRDLRETYLPAFKSLVQDADVRQVMCAYQRLEDEPCCGNTRLLQRILREEWGYKYLVVTDCDVVSDFFKSHKVSSDGTHAVSKAVLAGTDVECAWSEYQFKTIPEAVSKGLITEEEINNHLLRVLSARFDLGEMDNDALVPWSNIPISVVNSVEHKKLALDMAHESMTLLQNKKSLLPLSKSVKKVAVIGPNAANELLMWGSYNGEPFHTTTILDGIKTKLPVDKVFYDKACSLTDSADIKSVIDKCSFEGKAGIKATYWNNRDFKGDIVATDQLIESIHQSTFEGRLFRKDVNNQEFSAKYETIYRPLKSGEIKFKVEACGGFELLINGKTISNFSAWRTIPSRTSLKVEEGKEYHIEVLFKQQAPWPANINLDFGMEVPYKFDALLEKLKDIDVVVFAGGISSVVEGEELPIDIPGFKGGDRTNIDLPLVQRNCLKALKQAGKKVIFVNCSGSAIALTPETGSCDAILQAWYAGELGGQAIADVLFGDYNPAGKLPITFYKSSEQLKDFEDYSMKGRTYRFMNDALFPFGFGLSYTNFNIGNAKFSTTQIKNNESLELTIPVTNIGKRDGTEIVQVYVRKLNDTDGPLKTLKGFQRLGVAAGKTGQAVITLPFNSFEFYDNKNGKMSVAPGIYEVLYGNSSDDKDLKITKVNVL